MREGLASFYACEFTESFVVFAANSMQGISVTSTQFPFGLHPCGSQAGYEDRDELQELLAFPGLPELVWSTQRPVTSLSLPCGTHTGEVASDSQPPANRHLNSGAPDNILSDRHNWDAQITGLSTFANPDKDGEGQSHISPFHKEAKRLQVLSLDKRVSLICQAEINTLRVDQEDKSLNRHDSVSKALKRLSTTLDSHTTSDGFPSLIHKDFGKLDQSISTKPPEDDLKQNPKKHLQLTFPSSDTVTSTSKRTTTENNAMSDHDKGPLSASVICVSSESVKNAVSNVNVPIHPVPSMYSHVVGSSDKVISQRQSPKIIIMHDLAIETSCDNQSGSDRGNVNETQGRQDRSTIDITNCRKECDCIVGLSSGNLPHSSPSNTEGIVQFQLSSSPGLNLEHGQKCNSLHEIFKFNHSDSSPPEFRKSIHGSSSSPKSIQKYVPAPMDDWRSVRPKPGIFHSCTDSTNNIPVESFDVHHPSHSTQPCHMEEGKRVPLQPSGIDLARERPIVGCHFGCSTSTAREIPARLMSPNTSVTCDVPCPLWKPIASSETLSQHVGHLGHEFQMGQGSTDRFNDYQPPASMEHRPHGNMIFHESNLVSTRSLQPGYIPRPACATCITGNHVQLLQLPLGPPQLEAAVRNQNTRCANVVDSVLNITNRREVS